jgi:hypothetical protein
LIARYGQTQVSVNSNLDTFDFITVQLYEGYSHAEYHCSIEKMNPPQVVVEFVSAMAKGYTIDFSTDADLHFPETKTIVVPPSRLVVGLANGWAGDGKFLLIYPDQVSHLSRAPCFASLSLGF